MKTVSKNISIVFLFSMLSVILMNTQSKAQDTENTNHYKLELSFLKDDTINKAKAVVTSIGSANEAKPVKDVEVTFYAKKSYGLLPLGDAQTTDENGEATVEFPTDLPGDSAGGVQVIARVEDNDELGNLEDSKVTNWGIPTFVDNEFHRRALWGSAANAPLPLVFTVTTMVVLVWGVIIYIVILLFKIPKS